MILKTKQNWSLFIFSSLIILFLGVVFNMNSFAQTIGNGTIHGNFEADAQQYTPDSAIGAAEIGRAHV